MIFDFEIFIYLYLKFYTSQINFDIQSSYADLIFMINK